MGQRAGRESKCRGGVEGEQEKAGAEDVEISDKAPVIIVPVRGQSQHFRTKLGNGKAPQSGRAEEQRVCSQGGLKGYGCKHIDKKKKECSNNHSQK
jgi:hypothetical protein